MYSKMTLLYIREYAEYLTLFSYRLLQNTEYSSLCYSVGPYYLSILYIVVCICYSQHMLLNLSLRSKIFFNDFFFFGCAAQEIPVSHQGLNKLCGSERTESKLLDSQ